MVPAPAPVGAPGGRSWLLRLVIAFGFAQGAVSMARPAVSYRALAVGADERAIGVITAVYALLPLFAAVPLGRRTDHGRCAPLLVAGVVLISAGCALSGTSGSLTVLAAWSGVMGLGHLCFVIGAQSIVARRSAPDEQDRNFGHFTVGASLGQLVGPAAAGLLVSGQGDEMARTSALALLVSAAAAAVSFTSLWRIEARTAPAPAARRTAKVPVHRILRTRGVPAGIFISLAVLSATDILTAYLPVIGEQRGIAPTVIGLLLSLRAAATIACRLVMTPLIRWLGRTVLLTVTCLLGGLLCAGIALPVPVWGLAPTLAALGRGGPTAGPPCVRDRSAPAAAWWPPLCTARTGVTDRRVAPAGRSRRRPRPPGAAVRRADGPGRGADSRPGRTPSRRRRSPGRTSRAPSR